jgi:hypothetical protein
LAGWQSPAPNKYSRSHGTRQGRLQLIRGSLKLSDGPASDGGGPVLAQARLGPYADKKEETFAVWKAGIAELGKCQNVVVKLGGLGMLFGMFDFHTRETPPSSEELARAYKPYIESCVAAFGSDRGMFESNFPPDGVSSSYAVLWNAFKRLAAGYSARREVQAVQRHGKTRLSSRLELGGGCRGMRDTTEAKTGITRKEHTNADRRRTDPSLGKGHAVRAPSSGALFG